MSARLAPGERLALGPDGPTRLRVQVAWRQARSLQRLLGRRRPFDLDASCMLVDASGRILARVGHRQPVGPGGAVRHLGGDAPRPVEETRAGHGYEDPAEVLEVDLEQVPAAVESLVFAVTTFPGRTFDRLTALDCRVLDDDTFAEIAHSELPARGSHTVQWVVALTRERAEPDAEREYFGSAGGTPGAGDTARGRTRGDRRHLPADAGPAAGDDAGRHRDDTDADAGASVRPATDRDRNGSAGDDADHETDGNDADPVAGSAGGGARAGRAGTVGDDAGRKSYGDGAGRPGERSGRRDRGGREAAPDGGGVTGGGPATGEGTGPEVRAAAAGGGDVQSTAGGDECDGGNQDETGERRSGRRAAGGRDQQDRPAATDLGWALVALGTADFGRTPDLLPALDARL